MYLCMYVYIYIEIYWNEKKETKQKKVTNRTNNIKHENTKNLNIQQLFRKYW